MTLRINGDAHTVDVAPDTPLLWVIRDAVGLTGTKFGCGCTTSGVPWTAARSSTQPGLPSLAPAVTNALFVLTGTRVRRLPIRAEALSAEAQAKGGA